jgi:hypothetical protein
VDIVVLGEFLRKIKTPARTTIYIPVIKGETFEFSGDSDKIPMEYNKHELKEFEVTPDGEIRIWI